MGRWLCVDCPPHPHRRSAAAPAREGVPAPRVGAGRWAGVRRQGARGGGAAGAWACQCPPALISAQPVLGAPATGDAQLVPTNSALGHSPTTWGLDPRVPVCHAPAAAPPGPLPGPPGGQPPDWPAADPGQPAGPGSGACWCRLSPWRRSQAGARSGKGPNWLSYCHVIAGAVERPSR